jgi:hypothetical protein
MCRRKSKKDLLHGRMSGFVLKTGQLMRGWTWSCSMGWRETAVATNDLVSGQKIATSHRANLRSFASRRLNRCRTAFEDEPLSAAISSPVFPSSLN